jgi:hypothetical protein
MVRLTGLALKVTVRTGFGRGVSEPGSRGVVSPASVFVAPGDSISNARS